MVTSAGSTERRAIPIFVSPVPGRHDHARRTCMTTYNRSVARLPRHRPGLHALRCALSRRWTRKPRWFRSSIPLGRRSTR